MTTTIKTNPTKEMISDKEWGLKVRGFTKIIGLPSMGKWKCKRI
jgi:hypothetical protein